MARRWPVSTKILALVLVVLIIAATSLSALYLRGPVGHVANVSSVADNKLEAALKNLSSAGHSSSSTFQTAGNQEVRVQSSPSLPEIVLEDASPVTEVLSAKEIYLTVVPTIGYNHSYFKSPIVVVIGINNTVTWINSDASWHSVKSLNGTFDSGNIWTDSAFTFTFTKPGTYPYYCTYHLNMKGTIIVKVALG